MGCAPAQQAQDFAAFTRRDLRPGLLRRRGGVQGSGAVLGTGIGNAQQDVARGRILDIEGLPRGGGPSLTIDKQARGNRGQQFALALCGNSWQCSNSHDDSLVSRGVAAVCRRPE